MARPKEFERDEALKAALGIFRKKGFSATSTDDLRLAMRIGRQSFYDTFKGKKEMYLEALRKYNSDRVLGYFEIFRKSDSPLKAIEEMRGVDCLGASPGAHARVSRRGVDLRVRDGRCRCSRH